MRGSKKSLRLSLELKDPETTTRAIAEITKAFRTTKGNLVHAAKELGVSRQALMRWVHDVPALEESVRKVREEYGAMHYVGSPSYAYGVRDPDAPAPKRKAAKKPKLDGKVDGKRARKAPTKKAAAKPKKRRPRADQPAS